MSLINEALKKAQRQRHEAAPGPAAGADAGGVGKRAQPRSAQTTLVIVAAAVVLVVISIAGTAFWLTRSTSQPANAATVKSTSGAPKAAEPAAPAVTFNSPTAEQPKSRQEHPATPVTKATPPAAEPTPVTTMAASMSTTSAKTPEQAQASSAVPVTGTAYARGEGTPPTSAKPAATTREQSVAATSSAPTSTKAESPAPAVAKTERPTPSAQPDERIQRFIDNLKVAGVRPSGADSKVLMNDRVYRLNDLVDRSLGLRLTKVMREALTFTDANGVVYVKDL